MRSNQRASGAGLLALLLLPALLVACGGDPSEETSAEPSPDGAEDPVPPAGASEAAVPRRFEVGGAEVWVATPLDGIPQQATAIRVTTTLIDDGSGFKLCLGGAQLSLPPQCSGPVVDGLEPGDWTETSGAVRWGERTVTVEWPPVDGRLTLLDEQPVTAPGGAFPDPIGPGVPDEPPAGCAAIETMVPVDQVMAYAERNSDRVGIPYLIDDTVAVLPVVEAHLEDVRAELSADGAEPCLLATAYSRDDLWAAQAAVDLALMGPDGPVLSTAPTVHGRVEVHVRVADGQTVARVLDVVDDPGMITVVGGTEIIEGHDG